MARRAGCLECECDDGFFPDGCLSPSPSEALCWVRKGIEEMAARVPYGTVMVDEMPGRWGLCVALPMAEVKDADDCRQRLAEAFGALAQLEG
jgi:hypothetical protein